MQCLYLQFSTITGDCRSVRARFEEEHRQDRRRVEREDDGQVRLRLQRGLHGRVEDSDSQKDLQKSCRAGLT